MNYKQSIDYLESLPTPDKWSLEAPKRFAKQVKVTYPYEIIHVAGTNGKGSVCAFISAILQSAGFKVGMYTSPHLEKYNERIKINGKDISDSDFAKLISKLRPEIERLSKSQVSVSIFEALTILAFKYFESKKIDFLVLETGMGGKLDATNIAPSRVQAISSISFDHMANLGATLPKITSEKAGIIKPNSFVSTSSKDSESISIIRLKAMDSRSKISVLNGDFRYLPINNDESGGSFDYFGQNLRLMNVKINLIGAHQFENASLALSVIENIKKLGFTVPEAAIRRGLVAAKWPGRLEIVKSNPIILLDGAHNSDGISKLKEALKTIFKKSSNRKIILIIGIMADKDYSKMLYLISPIADELILTRAAMDRSATPQQLAHSVSRLFPLKKFHTAPSVASAIGLAKKLASRSDVICIAGSLYVVGEAKPYFAKKG